MSAKSRLTPLNIPTQLSWLDLQLISWTDEGCWQLYKALCWMREHRGDPAYIARIEHALGLKPGEKR